MTTRHYFWPVVSQITFPVYGVHAFRSLQIRFFTHTPFYVKYAAKLKRKKQSAKNALSKVQYTLIQYDLIQYSMHTYEHSLTRTKC